ncbi:MAG: ATPase, T2SS/T4P/T4SS family, partial [Pseudomonadota bacterium]
MFGKRGSGSSTGNQGFGGRPAANSAPPPAPAPAPVEAPAASTAAPVERAPAATEPAPAPAPKPVPEPMQQPMGEEPSRAKTKRDENYYDTKTQVFSALIETIDLSQLSKLDAESAREEIRDIVNDIIAIKNYAMSIAAQEELLEDICNDVLGYGPLEPLLARDDIADIMINGPDHAYIEVSGKVERADIRFRDGQQLLSICQRIVSQVGRRVDEASPICDARLADGSRVNVIAPPLAIDGT